LFSLRSRPLGNDSWASGGLGAALSQYSTSTKDQGQLLAEPTAALVKSRSSGGSLLMSAQNRTTSSRSERKRAISPVFNSRSQFPERHFESPTYLSAVVSSTSALLDPPDLHRVDASKQSATQRPRDESGLNPSALSSTVFRSSSKATNRGMVRSMQIIAKEWQHLIHLNSLLFLSHNVTPPDKSSFLFLGAPLRTQVCLISPYLVPGV
jgi:hypothetical protein